MLSITAILKYRRIGLIEIVWEDAGGFGAV